MLLDSALEHYRGSFANKAMFIPLVTSSLSLLASLHGLRDHSPAAHAFRDTAYAEDASTGYTGNGPQVMATLRNLAISLLYLSGVTEITRTLQAIARDRIRILDYLPL